MDERSYQLKELGSIVTGKTPSTKVEEYYGGKTPFLTPSDDMTGKFSPRTARTLSDEGLSQVRRCLVPKGSICVSCIGSVGKAVVASEPLVTNQQINTLIPNEAIVDRDFLYYTLVIVGKRLNFLSKTSTAVPIVNKSSFGNEVVALPALDEQKRIGRLLSLFDDSIANLNRTNRHLAA